MRLFTFPNPVNDKAARTVAAVVFMLGAVTLATGWVWLAAVITVGFLLRVAAGPRFSPLGRLATKIVAPRLGRAKLVPGPPKRFAQAIGFGLTAAATVSLMSGHRGAADALLVALLVAALLESMFAFCLGCWIFARLMQVGMIPRSVCLQCANTAYE